MTETYRLDEKQLPDIPVPHDCGIKSIRLADRDLEFVFEDDISRHDAVRSRKPDAKSLVMRFHLACEPEECEVLQWVPDGDGHYRVTGLGELAGLTGSGLEYLYHDVGYRSVILRLFCGGKVNGPVILIAEADAVGVEWIC